MLNAIILLIIFYLVFRFLTTYLIPVMTQKRIKRYQEKFKRENPAIFERRKDKSAEESDKTKK